MSYTFFTISVPDAADPKEWANRMWDTYGFDYDLERVSTDTVLAWALEGDEELKSALDEDGIEYRTFQVEDLDQFLGLG